MQGWAADDESCGYFGIDVSKASLDCYWGGTWFSVANAPDGFARLLERLRQRSGAPIAVVEATGRLHEGVWRALDEAGVPVAVVDPLRARRFAGAKGLLAKTDRIDARVLAEFGPAIGVRPTPIPSEDALRAKHLAKSREAMKRERVRASNRARETDDPLLRAMYDEQKALLETQIETLGRELERLARRCKRASRVLDIALSVPGLGLESALAFAFCAPELGQASDKEIAALLGLAPMNHDSGQRRGHAHIRGGRAGLRSTLYMAALSAGRANPQMIETRNRLKKTGKKPKAIAIAIARKLAILLNALVRDDRTWTPKLP